MIAASVALLGLVTGVGTLVLSATAQGSNNPTTAALSVRGGSTSERPHVTSTLARTQEAQTDSAAETTIGHANVVITDVRGKIDATQLTQSVVSLANYKLLDTGTVVSLIDQTETAAAAAQAAAAEADRAAAAAVAAAAAAAANTPDGARATARAMAASKYGWGDPQFSCLAKLWTKESGWSYTAHNPSGATGIPQALPGSKMATAGADWKTNATTQVAWGLDYISRSYGTPCSAWAHSQSSNWY
jgi:hypothetical protein